MRFIGDDKSDFDLLSFSATSTFALHAIALDYHLRHEESGNSIDTALAPPSPELRAAHFQIQKKTKSESWSPPQGSSPRLDGNHSPNSSAGFL